MAVKDVKYIGSKNDDRGYSALICEKHNWRETATYAYQLEELECPVCVTLADREYQAQHERAWLEAERAALRGHPSICLCPACAPWEAEYDRMQAEEDARLFVAELRSPGYCDHQSGGLSEFCMMSGCIHAACKADAEPPF